MPKLKTHKGAKSRFSITGSGKLMRTKCGKSHLRRKKAARTKRLYGELIPASTADKKRIRKLIPYNL
jgi:large subunit ribosomal protein L35